VSSSRNEAAKWLVLIGAGTLVVDWCVRVLAGIASTVLPLILLSVIAVAAVLVFQTVQRRGGRGW